MGTPRHSGPRPTPVIDLKDCRRSNSGVWVLPDGLYKQAADYIDSTTGAQIRTIGKLTRRLECHCPNNETVTLEPGTYVAADDDRFVGDRERRGILGVWKRGYYRPISGGWKRGYYS